MNAPMIGTRRHYGPGGRDCACCNEAPGKARVRDRRNAKRAERNKVNRMLDKREF